MSTPNIIEFILAGTLFGLSAGFSPGPLLTLVINQTLKHNRTEGIKVAVSPLFTDLPIILLAAFVFSSLSQFDTALAAISFIGGLFLIYLGVESIRIKGISNTTNTKTDSLKKGIIANFLNPSPYLFWTTVGVPLIFKTLDIHWVYTLLFMLSFYMMLFGSKIAIAIAVSKAKTFIENKLYIIIMRILGIALLAFSAYFFYDGLRFLGIEFF